MIAIVHDRYGPPDVLELREIERPQPADDEILVRVRAASLNPADWYGVTGIPWIAFGLRRREQRHVGIDFAGIVEAAGKEVRDLQPGDEVFGGGRSGAIAEYVCAGDAVARKPANVTFEAAAAVPVAARTALQGLRDHGRLQPGQRVLINGGSGGVGTFAVQIAKVLGGEVTAVCSTRNVELVRSLGADHVLDYTREDFSRLGGRYDVILDIAGSSWRRYKRVLKPQGTLVIIGAAKTSRMFGPLGHIARVRLATIPGRRKGVFFIAKRSRSDLEFIAQLLKEGEVTPVIEKVYELGETRDAFRHLGEGHAQGKLVIRV